MRDRKTVTAGIVITGIILLFSSVLAEQEPAPVCPGHEQCHQAMPEPMIGPPIPDLIDTQQEQLQALQLKHLREILPIENEIQLKKLELIGLWQGEKLEAQKIIAKVKELSELKSKLALARVNHQLEIYKILTPEQRKSFLPFLGIEDGPRPMMRHRFRHKMQERKRQRGPCPQR